MLSAPKFAMRHRDRMLTSTFITVPDITWGSIVTSTDDTLLADEDTADSALHAIAA